MKVYVASSWRNSRQPGVVQLLKREGHEVYDFRSPAPGNTGFSWSAIDPHWRAAEDPADFVQMLNHPIAQEGFRLDMEALWWAEAVALILPCGRSAHLELGYAVGAGKWTAVLLSDAEPELMYLMVDHLCLSAQELVEALR